MFRSTKPIWIVILVFTGVVMLGSLPAVAIEGVKISRVKLTDEDPNKPGYIETDIDGITPINPVYCEDDVGQVCNSMTPAVEAWICMDDPYNDPLSISDNCRKVITSTFGAAWNTWVCWGGKWFYIAP